MPIQHPTGAATSLAEAQKNLHEADYALWRYKHTLGHSGYGDVLVESMNGALSVLLTVVELEADALSEE